MRQFHLSIVLSLICFFTFTACGSSSSGGGGGGDAIETAAFDPTAVTAEDATIGGKTVTREIVSNRVVVSLASGKTWSDLESSLPSGYSIVGKNTELGIYEVGIPSGTSVSAAITAISVLSVVSSAGHDVVMETFLTPNDETFTSGVATDTWPYTSSYATWAWDLTTGASDVLIAIIDSGVDLDHAEFTDRIISGHDYYANDATSDDEDGHGTAVAGMAVATGNNAVKMAGMNWLSKILAIRVCSDGEGSVPAALAGVSEVLKSYATSYDMVIINTSMGVELDPSISADVVLINAFKAAAQKCADALNCLWIAPAGNEDKDATYVYPAALSQTATYPVISVGGINSSDGRWSGTYTVGDQNNVPKASNYGTSVEISTAANEIYALQILNSATTNKWGTSLSSPLVAGAASIIRTYFDGISIDVTPAGLKTMLVEGGDTLSTDQPVGKKLNLRGAILYGLGLHSKAMLSISCNVEGATISVDGTDTGKTTTSSGNYTRFATTSGTLAVSIAKSGYSTYSGSVMVADGEEETIEATLTASGSSTTQTTYGPYAYSATPVTNSISIPAGATVYIGSAPSAEGEKSGFFSCGYAGYVKINDSYIAYNMYYGSLPSGSDWTKYYFSSTSDYYYASTSAISSNYALYRSTASLSSDGKWMDITNLVNLGATNTFVFYHYTVNPVGYVIRIDQ